MFYLGVTAALLFILVLGLTVMRLLDNQVSPNAVLLADLINDMESGQPADKKNKKPSSTDSALYSI